MSREIKFRAFFDGRMVPVSILHFPHLYANSSEVEGNLGIVPIMQFTGLKDKNGKEIYERDIIKLNGGGPDVLFAVDFEDGCFVARVPWKMENSPELKAYCFFKEEIMTVEIIGNIYENPELLNTEPDAQECDATDAK